MVLVCRCVAVRERASERRTSERASGEQASERRASERASERAEKQAPVCRCVLRWRADGVGGSGISELNRYSTGTGTISVYRRLSEVLKTCILHWNSHLNYHNSGNRSGPPLSVLLDPDDHSGSNKLPSMALTADSDMQDLAAALEEVALPAACASR